MLKFEDRASQKALRLVGMTNEITIEIGLYYPFGEFYIDVVDNEGKAKSFLFQDFKEVLGFITEKFGGNNLNNFEKKANFLYAKMDKDKYVKKWKKEQSRG